MTYTEKTQKYNVIKNSKHFWFQKQTKTTK